MGTSCGKSLKEKMEDGVRALERKGRGGAVAAAGGGGRSLTKAKGWSEQGSGQWRSRKAGGMHIIDQCQDTQKK